MSDVLVIDANNDSLAMLTWFLSQNGHDVHRATTVVEAFDLITRNTPDALVIDLDLPGMTGHEFLAALRQQGLAAGAQVVVLGKDADARSAVRSWELGAREHLVRPVHPGRIAEALVREPSVVG